MEVNQRHAEVCAALGDVHRLLLLYAMADQPRSVTELVHRVGLSQPAVSRHLRILREGGVVTAERRGRSIYYFPVDARIIQVMDLLRTILTEQMQKQSEAANGATLRPHV